ncbi:unnamed protein product [Laminaria digitata]
MADLTCRLRERSNTPVHARHSLALEAIQLYVPVSNALGLGSSFLELEELGYKALFPQTYSNIAQWHRGVKGRSHDIVHDVKRRMLEALRAREDIAERVRGYHLEGRTKGLVSTFRKVFRQNKRATDVHDIVGFRIVVNPGSPPPRVHAASITGKPGTTSAEEGSAPSIVEVEGGGSGEVGVGGGKEASKPARSVFTVKTFPPPYRDDDSRLLHDVYEVLVELFEEVPGRYKNYVDFPKANGYRSVHTTVLHPSGLKMEFQVRTAKMHSDAEGGGAAHSLYKGNLENPAEASLFRSKMTPKSPPMQQHRLSSKKGKSATPTTAGVGSPAVYSPGGNAVPLLETKCGERNGEGTGQPGKASDLGSNRGPEP